MRRAFIAGARSGDQAAIVITETTGTFDDPMAGYQMSGKMFSEGADIVFSCAGKSGTGGIRAAAEHNAYYFGTDINQIPLDPEHVLGSRMKNIDIVVLDMVKKLTEGDYSGGLTVYSLKDNGLDVLLNEKLVSPDITEKTEETKKRIIEGRLDVVALSEGIHDK